MVDSLKIYDVPIRTLVAFLEATATHPRGTLEQLANYAGFGISTARRALPSLLSLNLVKQDDGQYISVSNNIQRGTDEESGRLFFRRALQSYRPFESLC